MMALDEMVAALPPGVGLIVRAYACFEPAWPAFATFCADGRLDLAKRMVALFEHLGDPWVTEGTICAEPRPQGSFYVFSPAVSGLIQFTSWRKPNVHRWLLGLYGVCQLAPASPTKNDA
jgi:hypothetical protein